MVPQLLSKVTIVHWVAVVLLLFVIVSLVRRRYFSPISDIPGPFIATFGVFWQLWHIYKGHTEAETIKLHQKHGHFVRISHDEVSVSHPDAPHLVLAAPLRKGDFYSLFAIPNSAYNNAMSERDPKRHKEIMRNIAPGYAFSNVIRSEPYMDRYIGLLEKRLDELEKQKSPVELSTWISFLTFDILGHVTFSKQFGFLEAGRDIGNAINTNYALSIYVTVASYTQWLHACLLGNPILRWLDFQPSQHVFDTCVAAVNDRKQIPDVREDMMGQWLTTRREHPERMKEKEIFCAAVTNVGAGSETMSATIQGFFYYLLKNPCHMARLHDEIDAAQERGELSAVVSYAEAQRLPFLQACIKESLRFHSGVSFGLPRVVPQEGLTIGGRHFTEGTILSVNPWVIHRSVECFGSDAHIFNPERWLDPLRSKTIEKYLIPFGLGYSACPGRNLANVELSKITATLIRDFDIRQVDPAQEWKFRSLFIAVPWGWPCWVKRRNNSGPPHTADLGELKTMTRPSKGIPTPLDLHSATTELYDAGERREKRGPLSPDLEAALKSRVG